MSACRSRFGPHGVIEVCPVCEKLATLIFVQRYDDGSAMWGCDACRSRFITTRDYDARPV